MFDLILIFIALCTTTFAISLTSNVKSCLSKFQSTYVIFILTMVPLVMLWLGMLFGKLIKSITAWDHLWLLAVVSLIIGLRLLIKAFRSTAEERSYDLRNFKILLLISIALGMNSLMMGSGLVFLIDDQNVVFLTFSITSLSLSILGMIIGKKKGLFGLGNKMELFGGFILVGLAVKMILQLFAVI